MCSKLKKLNFFLVFITENSANSLRYKSVMQITDYSVYFITIKMADNLMN